MRDKPSDPTLKFKYIKICEGSVRVKIERSGHEPSLRHFRIRNFPSLRLAVMAAKAWRDEEHQRRFGIPVLDRIHQLKRRKDVKEHKHPVSGEVLPSLSPGLSYGYHRGRLLYVVASFQENGQPRRVRFPISPEGIPAAIEKAALRRLDALTDLA